MRFGEGFQAWQERMRAGRVALAAAAFVGLASACGIGIGNSSLTGIGGPPYPDTADGSASADAGGGNSIPTHDAAAYDSGTLGPGTSPLCGNGLGATCDPSTVACGTKCAMEATGMDGGYTTTGTGDQCADAGAIFACHMTINNNKTVEPTCTALGPTSSTDGHACYQSSDCAAGYECVKSSGAPAAGICRRYCCDNQCNGGDDAGAPTPGNLFCDIEPTVTESLQVPVCREADGCALFQACPIQGETCTVVDPQTGLTSCVTPENQQVGESCEEKKCAPGLACWGTFGKRACVQLCQVSGTSCPMGTTCQQNSNFSGQNSGAGVCL